MTSEQIELLKFKVGGLLYTPALKTGVANKIKDAKYQYLTSLAFCLEDSIVDSALELAENTLKTTLVEIKSAVPKENLPLLFIRIRTPEHLEKIYNLVKDELDVITGFILPKFDLTNGQAYLEITKKINEDYKVKPIFIMPILESTEIVNIKTRTDMLCEIKELLEDYREYILNIRVGANDLCNYFGLRRSVDSSIYDIGVIKNILLDIIAVFGVDYVISGPVWEYFSDMNNSDFKKWSEGLENELRLDRLNGFFGKTAVHPSQLPIIYNSLKVSKSDYDDAINLLNWDNDGFGVGKSNLSCRMNEVKCHTKWAKNIYFLSQIYGVRED